MYMNMCNNVDKYQHARMQSPYREWHEESCGTHVTEALMQFRDAKQIWKLVKSLPSNLVLNHDLKMGLKVPSF